MSLNVFNRASWGWTQYSFQAGRQGGIVRAAWLLAFFCLAGGNIAQAAGVSAFRPGYAEGAYGTAINPPRPLPAVELVNELGEAFSLDQLQGHSTLLFFGFTHCPHVCPTTLSMLKGVRDRLPPEVAQPLQVWLISVDPMRDSAEQLRDYLQKFGPGFHGGRAGFGELVPLLKNLGIAYAYRPNESGGGYNVDHTSAIFLLDRDARLTNIYTAPHDIDRLLESLTQILN